MAQAVPAAALMPPRHWRFRKAMSPVFGIGPEASSILPCAAAFCLTSKLALPFERDAGEKRIGAAGAPGRRHDERPDPRNAPLAETLWRVVTAED
jgi:hypothetical protein